MVDTSLKATSNEENKICQNLLIMENLLFFHAYVKKYFMSRCNISAGFYPVLRILVFFLVCVTLVGFYFLCNVAFICFAVSFPWYIYQKNCWDLKYIALFKGLLGDIIRNLNEFKITSDFAYAFINQLLSLCLVGWCSDQKKAQFCWWRVAWELRGIFVIHAMTFF